MHVTGGLFFIEKQMPTGIVKWFDLGLGYGLIQPDSGDREVLVHISAVRKAGLGSLTKGARLSYELVNRLGKQSAHDLQAWASKGFAVDARLKRTAPVGEDGKPEIAIRPDGTERF
jgi:CspA family cold shock protein